MPVSASSRRGLEIRLILSRPRPGRSGRVGWAATATKTACSILLGLAMLAVIAYLVADACRARTGASPVISFEVDEFIELKKAVIGQQLEERAQARYAEARREAERYKGIKVRSEPGVQNVAAIEGAFVRQDPNPAERLEYFNRYLTKRDRIIHVGWHGVFLKETQDDQGSLVEVKIVPIFVSTRGGFGMIRDHCVETWRYSPDGKLTFVKLVPGENTRRGVIAY
jgi:hypothetical protein